MEMMGWLVWLPSRFDGADEMLEARVCDRVWCAEEDMTTKKKEREVFTDDFDLEVRQARSV